MKLVVVESPNKCEKIRKYLGPGYEVAATVGHFRDLPEDELGVDVATFDPVYVVADSKRAVLSKLRAKAASADEVLLGTDADREGEAIAWHVAQVLRLRGPKRIRFSEITEAALKKAVAGAGPLDQDLVDAQQGRRVIDRLVGYQVSPLLRPLGSNHSAGRVQSATLHLVVLREKEREAFKAAPYWTLTARYGNGFAAEYATNNEKGELADARLKSEADARRVVDAARGLHLVEDVKTAPIERKPKPPFTTSTLQQAASIALGMRPDRTMHLAQSLFENGAITYHRTDSIALSPDAVAMARAFIARDFPAGLPDVPPVYRSKASAQEAHEAIRPTALDAECPDGVAGDELRLYDLIRRRFLASQCKPAVFARTVVAIRSGDTWWRGVGEVQQFAGFLHYLARDEDSEDKDDAAKELPRVRIGETLSLLGIDVKRKETTPPPRFTQASLIKEMERRGIGRPSTYAATLKTLFERDYIAEQKKSVYPTARGRLVDHVLERAFGTLVDASYTADMEQRLDEVASGARRWKDELRSWYAGFAPLLEKAAPIIEAAARACPELAAAAAAPAATGKQCPRCAAEVLLRQGKKGAFLACSSYPRCDYAANPSATPLARPCSKCGGVLEQLDGRFGCFARCTRKECGATEDLSPLSEVQCPTCAAPMRNKGAFYGCSRYPACKGTIDVKGLAMAQKAGKTCPKCSKPMLERKGAKGKFWGCVGFPACRHVESIATTRSVRGGARR